jgi:large subunit ribosomal protein L25
MDRVSLVVQPRDTTGTRAAGRLRKAGLIPGVLYGHGKSATLIAIDPHELRLALSGEAGRHAVLDITIAGHKRAHKAIVKEMQHDAVKTMVTHVDLQEIRLDEVIETTVTVHFDGECKGVKAGGMLEEAIREVTVKGKVTAIPEHLVLDITELGLGNTAKVRELQVPEGLEIVDDPDEVLCSVIPPRGVGTEGEEAEEEAAAAEPELVGKAGEAGEAGESGD